MFGTHELTIEKKMALMKESQRLGRILTDDEIIKVLKGCVG